MAQSTISVYCDPVASSEKNNNVGFVQRFNHLPGGSNVLYYAYAKRLNSASELTYVLEGRTNLVSGSWAPVSSTATAGYLDTDYERATNQIDSALDALFLRLKIETL